MGRRSRKRLAAETGEGRGAGPSGSTTRAERDATRRRRAEEGDRAKASPERPGAARGGQASRRRGGQRPAAPWGRFPLTELVALLAIVMGVGGLLVGVEEPRGRTLLFAGVALGSLAGLETAVRDHFAGYRSHTTLLSGAAAMASMVALIFLLKEIAPGIPLPVVLVVGAIVFALAFPLLRRVFQRRSGGLSYR